MALALWTCADGDAAAVPLHASCTFGQTDITGALICRTNRLSANPPIAHWSADLTDAASGRLLANVNLWIRTKGELA
jgi:hypothetical protein